MVSEPGFWQTLGESLFRRRRQFDCLQVELSSRCHGRCTFCPHTTMLKQWQERDMDMETFSNLLPLMRRSYRVHLQGWGEPFLNSDFFTMATMARNAGCDVSTTTCGLGMDSDRARNIVESGVDIVAFSLVGTGTSTNSSRRGVDFTAVSQGISTLRTAREKNGGKYPQIHLAYLLLASSMEAVADLPAMMQRLGVDSVVISTLDYLAEPALAFETFPAGDIKKIERASTLLREASVEAEQRGLGFHYEFPLPTSSGHGCRENIGRSLFVSADGSVSPCVFVNLPLATPDRNRRVFGNVQEKHPLEIWENVEYQAFRDRLEKADPDIPCQVCPKRFKP